MSFTKQTKRIAFGITLVLALAFTAPPALAGPAGTADLGTAVYGWLADAWQSLTAGVSGSSEELDGTATVAKGQSTEEGTDSDDGEPESESSDVTSSAFGPMVIPNG